MVSTIYGAFGCVEPTSRRESYSVTSRSKPGPTAHPLRTIHVLADPILVALTPRFDPRYARMGPPSTLLERLLRAPLPDP